MGEEHRAEWFRRIKGYVKIPGLYEDGERALKRPTEKDIVTTKAMVCYVSTQFDECGRFQPVCAVDL
jgi:hypothetical protein